MLRLLLFHALQQQLREVESEEGGNEGDGDSSRKRKELCRDGSMTGEVSWQQQLGAVCNACLQGQLTCCSGFARQHDGAAAAAEMGFAAEVWYTCEVCDGVFVLGRQHDGRGETAAAAVTAAAWRCGCCAI
jgi:hypothetical protein